MKARSRRPVRHPRRDVPKPASPPPTAVPLRVASVDPATNTFTVEVIKATPGTCRKCGCTDDNACLGSFDIPCSWADATHTLCSSCAPTPKARAA